MQGGGSCAKSIESKIQTPSNLHLLTFTSQLFEPLDLIYDSLFMSNQCLYLPKLYGIYKTFDAIDFGILPHKFVIKTNHDCGGVVMVQDKEAFLQDGISQARDKIMWHLQHNYYEQYREWHYKDIEPRIFVEELLGECIEDFRFHCFNGEVAFIQVANATHTRNDVFDTQWQKLDFMYLNPPSDIPPKKPTKFHLMLHLANLLSAPMNYVRVDLYCVDSRVYVGELTFTPNGGTGKFSPQSFDRYFGDLWHI
ncbi:ATP-grasp fold amidoligase family protein [Helicobacter mastomyrinus]|uniref:ATP-grasp fold amidoligase family protein n=4 Tax=Helicobacter TaxID=209 RepID=A0ABZ3F4Z3_9HELI|nr:ATP-grasp fold amidoligase family protein [uncultured Helicobacter sp.]